MLRILLATGQTQLNTIIETKILPVVDGELIGTVDCKSDLLPNVQVLKPNLVIVSKTLTGSDRTILETILELHRMMPSIRIIFLAGNVDTNNKEKILELGTLVVNGIFDIHHEKSITKTVLIDLIQNPRTREDVSYLLKYMDTNKINEEEIVEFEDEIEDGGDVTKNGYKNVILVSSIKPGTGKSFVSTNLATDIARFGIKKKDGSRPKVGLIEGDLQNLSLGTLLGFEDDDKYNLKTVMDRIATVFNPDGTLVDNALEVKKVNEFIIQSFKSYYTVKNLYALVGSQFRLDELDTIRPEYYAYLIEVAKDYFDVYAKTIKHEKSKKTQSGQDKWNYPDIVGVHFPFNDYSERETLELSQNLNRRDFKIYSFELKVSLDFSNLKESYFQAVSNSSFANEGYLVVFEELDSEVFDELRRLHSSFGIGLIKLEPTESSVLLPSLVRNLDFRTIDMLVNKNADFREFIDTINGDIQTNDKRRIALQYYDRVLDDEGLDRYLSEKGLRG